MILVNWTLLILITSWRLNSSYWNLRLYERVYVLSWTLSYYPAWCELLRLVEWSLVRQIRCCSKRELHRPVQMNLRHNITSQIPLLINLLRLHNHPIVFPFLALSLPLNHLIKFALQILPWRDHFPGYLVFFLRRQVQIFFFRRSHLNQLRCFLSLSFVFDYVVVLSKFLSSSFAQFFSFWLRFSFLLGEKRGHNSFLWSSYLRSCSSCRGFFPQRLLLLLAKCILKTSLRYFISIYVGSLHKVSDSLFDIKSDTLSRHIKRSVIIFEIRRFTLRPLSPSASFKLVLRAFNFFLVLIRIFFCIGVSNEVVQEACNSTLVSWVLFCVFVSEERGTILLHSRSLQI